MNLLNLNRCAGGSRVCRWRRRRGRRRSHEARFLPRFRRRGKSAATASAADSADTGLAVGICTCLQDTVRVVCDRGPVNFVHWDHEPFGASLIVAVGIGQLASPGGSYWLPANLACCAERRAHVRCTDCADDLLNGSGRVSASAARRRQGCDSSAGCGSVGKAPAPIRTGGPGLLGRACADSARSSGCVWIDGWGRGLPARAHRVGLSRLGRDRQLATAARDRGSVPAERSPGPHRGAAGQRVSAADRYSRKTSAGGAAGCAAAKGPHRR